MKPILIAGPTASGKSALALALAERLGACVINADALQVYAGWRVLTARPSPEEEARAPHFLYGHVLAADVGYSTGRWLREIAPLLAEANGRAVIVGGTGLYFKALTEGLAEIPPTPPEIRARAEARLAEIGAEAFAKELAARDPETAARIDLINPRRVMRAWEALETSGVGLAAWMDRTPPPILPLAQALALTIEPPRATLRRRIRTRFERMLETGALEEVAAMAAAERDGAVAAAAPALKALGYRPLAAHLSGALTRDAAVELGATQTNQYAKRQSTWARNQMAAWRSIPDAAAADIEALARAAGGPSARRER